MWQKLHSRFDGLGRKASFFSSPYAPQFAAWTLILLCGLVLLVRYPVEFLHHQRDLPGDFKVYYHAWERVQAGENPYQASDPSPYKYAPGVLALVHLLPNPIGQAWMAFASFCIVFLVVSLFIGARYQSWKNFFLLVIGLGLSWKGILETLDYGQLEILILGIAVLAASLQKRAPVFAGLLAGVLPWFKLPWLLFLFPLILIPVQSLSGPGRKERRVRLLISGYLFSWFLWGAAIPSLFLGSERAKFLTRSWLDLLSTQPHDLYFSNINQSAWVSALRWIGDGGMEARLLAFGAVAILGGLVLGRFSARALATTGTRDVFSWVSPWLVLTQLLNPLSWRWGSVFLVGVPFAIANAGGLLRKNRELRLTLGFFALVFWLLQLNPVAHTLGFKHWSEFHGFGLVTGYWVTLLILSL